MDSTTFFANFETIANASGGIARLRELILDLAVHGKLVDQEMSEDKPDFEVVDGLFEIADNWIWTSIEKIGIVNPRNLRVEDLDSGFVPMTHVQTSMSVSHGFEVRKWSSIKKGYTHLADGDVAVAKITPCFENGKSCVIQNLPNGIGAGTTELLVVRPNGVLAEYLLIYLKSPLFRENGIPRMTGTAGQKRLPTGYFKTFPLPLPPKAEQQQIAVKVDELMTMCDELEIAQNERDSIRASARKSSIDAISTATTPEELDVAWKRIGDNWTVIADTPESIDSLKMVILDLAVRGHLLPADNSTPRGDDGFPINWRSGTLEDAAEYIQRGKGPKYAVKSKVAVVSQKCVKWSGFDISEARFIDISSLSGYKEDRFLQSGDLLWNSTGTGTVGRTALFSEVADYPKVVADSHVTVIRAPKILPRFLWIWSASPTIQSEVLGSTTGSTNQQELNLSTIKALAISVPPIEEQKRIVAKVDELMALCDELERSLLKRNELTKKIAGSLASEVAA